MEHRILTVDLSSGKHEFQDVPLNLTKQYLEERGLNSKLLFDGTSRETNPLGPENLLVIGAGLLTGTAIPSSSRFTIWAKSPLTGGLGDGIREDSSRAGDEICGIGPPRHPRESGETRLPFHS